jgi:hypothetical protein
MRERQPRGARERRHVQRLEVARVDEFLAPDEALRRGADDITAPRIPPTGLSRLTPVTFTRSRRSEQGGMPQPRRRTPGAYPPGSGTRPPSARSSGGITCDQTSRGAMTSRDQLTRAIQAFFASLAEVSAGALAIAVVAYAASLPVSAWRASRPARRAPVAGRGVSPSYALEQDFATGPHHAASAGSDHALGSPPGG